jgi:phosphatidylglycerophosphatase A
MNDGATSKPPVGLAQRAALFLATGAGFGYSPVASGTVGTLWGLPLVWLMQGFPVWGQTVYALALTLLAIPICHAAEAVFQRKDDGRIVADEYMTFPVGLLGLPLHPAMLVFAFVTNRFFDILKPPPAAQFQRLKGGLGIVVDDLVAALYSLILNHVFYHLVLKAALAP